MGGEFLRLLLRFLFGMFLVASLKKRGFELRKELVALLSNCLNLILIIMVLTEWVDDGRIMRLVFLLLSVVMFSPIYKLIDPRLI